MSARRAAEDLARSAYADRLLSLTLLAGVLATLVARLMGDLAIGSAGRVVWETTHLLYWAIVCATALRLGTQVASPAWAAMAIAGPMSRAAWALGRVVGVAALLACQGVALVAIGALAGLPVGALALAGVALWLEAALWGAGAALLSCWTRPWMAAAGVAVVGSLGHLQTEYAEALATWGVGELAGWAWLALPGLDLVEAAGRGEPDTLGLATVHAVGWFVALAAATTASLTRRDLG